LLALPGFEDLAGGNRGVVSSSVSVMLSEDNCRLRRGRTSPFVKTFRLQIGHIRRFCVNQGSMQLL